MCWALLGGAIGPRLGSGRDNLSPREGKAGKIPVRPCNTGEVPPSSEGIPASSGAQAPSLTRASPAGKSQPKNPRTWLTWSRQTRGSHQPWGRDTSGADQATKFTGPWHSPVLQTDSQSIKRLSVCRSHRAVTLPAPNPPSASSQLAAEPGSPTSSFCPLPWGSAYTHTMVEWELQGQQRVLCQLGIPTDQ